MKELKTISLILLFLVPLILNGCISTLPAAGPTSELIDGTDKILLTVNETPDKAYKHFAQHLSDHGFGFENSDETLRILKTDFVQGDKLNYSYSINASIRGNNGSSIIQITGNLMHPMFAKSNDFEIRNRGAKGSIYQDAFKQMLELAKSYQHEKIMYERN